MPPALRDRLRTRLSAEARVLMIDSGVPAAIGRPMRWMLASVLALLSAAITLGVLAAAHGLTEAMAFAVCGFFVLVTVPISACNHAIGRALRRARAARYRLCPRCAYDLRDLGPRGTCPECGRPFERSAVRTQWLGIERRLKRG